MKKSYIVLYLFIISCAQHTYASELSLNNNSTTPRFIEPLKRAIENEDHDKVITLLQENQGINLTLYEVFTIDTNQSIRKTLITYHNEYFQRTKNNIKKKLL